MRRSRAAAIGALSAAALLFSADASRASGEHDALTALEEAAAVLEGPPDQAVPGHDSWPGNAPSAPAAEPVDATLALTELAASLPALEGADRRRARGLLSRPTDGVADQYGDGYPPGAPVRSAESLHFCVFWVDDPGYADAPPLADASGNGIPDYVDSILEIAEYSYSIEVAPGPLGWAPPKPDTSGCGTDPSARADVYLKQLGSLGLFGYESPDPGQGNARSQYGYMVLDNDYATAEYGYPDPLDPAKVTFAHEFNHLLQQNYDTFQDAWMFEATATWVENHVYPEIDDYLFYVNRFAASPGQPITDRDAADGLKIYGSAVWNHWLDSGGGGYGPAIVRRAWELSDVAEPRDFAVAAYDEAIRRAGSSDFSREFVAFAAATAEWGAGLGSFPDFDRYPDVKRKGALKPGRKRTAVLDHTAYRLLRVKPAGARALRLRVRVERGVRAGVALVGRDGSPAAATTTVKSRYLPSGGTAALRLDEPRRFERITAVLVNSDGRVRGFGGDDWIYTRDDVRFRAELSR